VTFDPTIAVAAIIGWIVSLILFVFSLGYLRGKLEGALRRLGKLEERRSLCEKTDREQGLTQQEVSLHKTECAKDKEHLQNQMDDLAAKVTTKSRS